MVEIDGSMGEGGGQVLRSALSLSCLTGKGFRIGNIRKSRSKPGLMHQHLMAVQSAAKVSGAELSGAGIGSQQLVFVPRGIQAGNYSFDIGTAGSTTLVLQTVLPPLLSAAVRSQVIVTGGTHVPFSPSWNYFAEIFLPAIARLGVRAEGSVEACGFYPRGGGRVRCRLEPLRAISPLWAMEPGRLLRVGGCSAVGNLPRSIAERQLEAARAVLQGELGRDLAPLEVDIGEVQVYGQGTFIFLEGVYEQGRAGFTAIGERGKPAEQVGEEAAREFLAHHRSGLPIDPHLADQLVLYLARAEGESTFATSRITNHLETNLQVAGLFLEMKASIAGEEGGPGTVTISPAVSAS